MGKRGNVGDRKESGTAGRAEQHSAAPLLDYLRRLVSCPAAAYLLLVIGLLTTVFVSVGAWRQSRSRDEDRFKARTLEIRNALDREFDRYSRLLQGARALWSIHPQVTRDEWRLYVEGVALSNAFPGLTGLGFIERVPANHLSNFLAEVRRDNSRNHDALDFQVHPLTSNREHYIVKFIEPFATNQPALGFDIATETNRCEAANWARDTDGLTLTHRIALVQAPNAPGALLLLPTYAPGIQATNLVLRRANLKGWVYTAFVVDKLLKHVLASWNNDVDVEVYEGPSTFSSALLFTSRPAPKAGEHPMRTSFERLDTLEYGNCIWTLRFQARPGFVGKPWLSAPAFMDAAMLGLCITVLLFGIVRTLASTGQRAQQLANEMTAKLRLQNHAMACARNGIFILDATRENCPIIYANPAFEKLTCYSVNGTLGEDTVNLLRDQASRGDNSGSVDFRQAGREGLSVVREYHRDGDRFWVDFRLLPVTDEHGRKTHYLGIVEDVTERKRAEKELAKAEQRYHELVDNLNVGVYRNTPGATGKFLEVNPAAVAMFEAASREELMNCHVSDLYLDPTHRRELSERILREGSVKDAEIELHTLKGRRFWAAITAAMKTDAEGKVFFDGVIVDISDRKEAEKALRESQERFALAVQGTNDGIWDWNVVTNEVYFSPRWKAMLGYQEHEVENTFAGWESLLHPEERKSALAAIQAYFSGQTPVYELEHRLRHKDGTYRWILARGVALRGRSGSLT